MSEDSKHEDTEREAANDKGNSRELANEVHWIQHATFWSQVGLGVIGIAALCIYHGQLTEMHNATKATQQSAYAACVGAQISRSLLIETERTEEDTHQAAGAAIAQSSVAIQTSIPVINPEIGEVAVASNLKIMHDIAFKNTGNTPALNVHIATRTVFVRSDETPPFIYPKKVTAMMRGGRIPANTQFPLNKISSYVQNPDGTVYVPSHADYQDFMAGNKDVLIFGYANYSDVFGNTHSMTFCQAARHVENGQKLRYGHSECFKYNKTDAAREKPLAKMQPWADEIDPIPCEKPKD